MSSGTFFPLDICLFLLHTFCLIKCLFLMKLDLDYFSDGCCDYFLLSCWLIGR
ncbi:hypothetical protein Hanom_Chr11g01023101 [Helianthus anomalus]